MNFIIAVGKRLKPKKKRQKTIEEVKEEILFIAHHTPGKSMSVDDRLRMDRILYGEAYYLINDDGSKTRIDPTKLCRISD